MMPARTWRSRHVRFLFASRARAATPAARGAARFMVIGNDGDGDDGGDGGDGT